MEKNIAELASIPYQTLVGKKLEVFDSSNKKEIGIKGKCVEDRANTVVIKTRHGEKTIIKKNVWFLVYVEGYKGYKVLVDGKKLVGRIEKRIKRQ
ncbi:MAG: ribonuclease P protein subunit [Candidatus Pacearchaeota archaeon]